MKKSFFCLLFGIMTVCVFGQELKANQVKINGTVFTLGINTYQNDYGLIFNKWYEGHNSASSLQRGESLNWVNGFTGKYSIETCDYDITVNHETVEKDLHGILFSGSGSQIKLVYDSGNKLRYISLYQTDSDVTWIDGLKVFTINMVEAVHGKDYTIKDLHIFMGNVLFEPNYVAVSISTALVGMNIALLESAVASKFKSDVDWVFEYETRTGRKVIYNNNSEKLTGLEIVNPEIRISRENKIKEDQERERLAEEQRQKMEQDRQERERREQQEQERARLTEEQRQKIEGERKNRDVAREQELQEHARLVEEQEREHEERIRNDWITHVKSIKKIQRIIIFGTSAPFDVGGSKSSDQATIDNVIARFGNQYSYKIEQDTISLLKDGREVFTLIYKGRRNILSEIKIVPENAYNIIQVWGR
ncbi:hypothetical protein TREPR_0643 [Treponema primitia ZAS-2]|uniref:Uncharacterized protein n=1 Tax=Treponema primitia (strain ATCC BAA-887 / DSM 12427 / ZAS-2) TaxID=545694 RepID=F5YK43_TREPZ|nr:hypothetical protein [Treponema primitia]AEF84991.1 hypothetical protein TREPR_0643 [Treponema primitia ZAS-2]